MFSCLYARRLCGLRFNSYVIPVKKFNRNSEKGWISIKSRKTLLPVSDNPSLGLKSLIKPFIFTVMFSGSCFVAASIWQYEELRKRAQYFMKNSVLFQSNDPAYKRFELRRQISSWWHSQTEGQKIAAVIIGINLFVFTLWKIPACYPLMRKYFCSSPALEASCLPMILSTFSHYSFVHLVANMFVLYSFSTTAVAFFGKEQFLALYGSAGVISSFTSYFYKVITGRSVISVGASGALMTILSAVCFQFPHAQLQILFLPFLTFSAGHAIKAVIALDIIGLFSKWKLFDHAAHLGGAFFGLAYLNYGNEYIWSKRGHIFSWYDKIRKNGT